MKKTTPAQDKVYRLFAIQSDGIVGMTGTQARTAIPYILKHEPTAKVTRKNTIGNFQSVTVTLALRS